MSEEELVKALLGLAVLTRRAFPRQRAAALDPNELQVLIALRVQPDQRPAELAQHLQLEGSTARHLLTVLRARRLVLARADRDDKRQVRYRLGARGERAIREYVGQLEQEVRRTLEHLAPGLAAAGS